MNKFQGDRAKICALEEQWRQTLREGNSEETDGGSGLWRGGRCQRVCRHGEWRGRRANWSRRQSGERYISDYIPMLISQENILNYLLLLAEAALPVNQMLAGIPLICLTLDMYLGQQPEEELEQRAINIRSQNRFPQ